MAQSYHLDIGKVLLLVLLGVPALAEDDGIRVVSWPTPPSASSSAAIKTVSVSNAAVPLLASRTGRFKVVLYNEKETLFIKAGTSASISDYTWRMAPATALEITLYSGPLTAVLGVIGPTTVHVSDF